MSANNFIKIFQENLEWMVEECDAESGKMIQDLGGWADLESAFRCANDYMVEEEVEYGLDIKL